MPPLTGVRPRHIRYKRSGTRLVVCCLRCGQSLRLPSNVPMLLDDVDMFVDEHDTCGGIG